jgi:hypothetical protein
MSATEQEYKNHIKELEQQVRLLKEQVDFLTRKLYGTKSEKTSTLEIEGQVSLFNEIETCADPDAHEPELVEIEKHLRKRKYTGQREELVEYSCAATPQIRQTGNRLSGLAETAYASLLAQCFV